MEFSKYLFQFLQLLYLRPMETVPNLISCHNDAVLISNIIGPKHLSFLNPTLAMKIGHPSISSANDWFSGASCLAISFYNSSPLYWKGPLPSHLLGVAPSTEGKWLHRQLGNHDKLYMFDVRPQQEASDFSSVQGLAPNLTPISLNINGHSSASYDQKSYRFHWITTRNPAYWNHESNNILEKPTFQNHLNPSIKI